MYSIISVFKDIFSYIYKEANEEEDWKNLETFLININVYL